jgi:hypothetical protein
VTLRKVNFKIIPVEIGPEIRSEDIKLDRLLELFISGKKKYEFYLILKKINNQISSKEFNEEKLISFKEMVLVLLEEFLTTSETSGQKMDKITIPYLFTVLKKSFFKLKSSSKRRLADPSITSDFYIKNTELMVKSFDLAIKFLTNELQEDIILAALNYLFKFLDEPMNIQQKSQQMTVSIAVNPRAMRFSITIYLSISTISHFWD